MLLLAVNPVVFDCSLSHTEYGGWSPYNVYLPNGIDIVIQKVCPVQWNLSSMDHRKCLLWGGFFVTEVIITL